MDSKLFPKKLTYDICSQISDFPGHSDSKSVCLQCGRPRFGPWVGKILWRRKWQPTEVLSPGKSHGQRSLVGYSPWGRKESDTTEQLHFHFHLFSRSFSGSSAVKNLPAMQETWVRFLPWSAIFPEEGNGNPLLYSCMGTPWTEKSGRLQPMELQRIGHDVVTKQQQSIFN